MDNLKNYINQFHPIIWVLLTGTVLSRGAMFMTMPFLAIYLSRNMEMHPLMIGLTVGISPLIATIGGFIGGHLSDRFGRKPVLMVSLITISLVFYGFSIAEHPLWFILLNALNGLSNSFFEPTSQALMADLTKKEERMKAYSLRYTAINIGAAAGPLAGAYWANLSTESTFVITGSVYLIYAVTLTAFLNKFKLGSSAEIKSNVTFLDALSIVKRDSAFRYLILGIIMVNIGYSQLQSTLPMHLEKELDEGIFIFSILLSINAVMVVFLQMPVSAAAEKFNPMQTMVTGAIFIRLGLAGFGFTDGWILSIVSVTLLTLGEILIFPANSVLIDRLAPQHLRGIYFGAGQFRKIGHFAGPVMGGFLFHEAGGTIMLWLVSLIALTSLFFFSYGSRSFVKGKAKSIKII
ncbi:MFS transporter [Rossellomorea vietnamensis]|uniref:MFS transporter n=1 Tax=Rossellomorea vietnamensis TaxID=218284 RepID=A0A5D4MBF7_9BACI|nr:MFS transporter [Rossellomorea vietnamensis]TYR99289.1 MFS transporter [Rossellomorea vietnamensis]